MFTLFVFLHVTISVLLILVVLMQSGKGGGLTGAFGGGNQTVFGGRGAVDFLGKATWVLGSGFMLTSLILALLSAHRSEPTSLIQKATPAASAPMVPAPSTPLPESGGETAPATETPASTDGGN